MSATVQEPRRPHVPTWAVEIARPARGPVPWPGMTLAALGIGLPVAVGLGVGRPVEGVVAAAGALVGSLVDRIGPYPLRMRRIACAGVFGATAGLLIGTAVHGHGWLAVGAMVVVAAVSALMSSVSATWSATGLQLLVYTALGTGPLGGGLRPWWLSPLWLLAGVCWMLVLLVPGWLLRRRTVERRRVAAVYRSLAASLRALGAEQFREARHAVAASLDLAYEELLSQRAAESGQDLRLAHLIALLNQARLAAEASIAVAYAGEHPPSQTVEAAEALASAVQDGKVIPDGARSPRLAEPPLATPAMRTLISALNNATDIASGMTPTDPGGPGPGGWPRERRGVSALADALRGDVATTFAVRLILCVGVAAVFAEVLPLPRSYWVILGVAVVLKPDFGSVFARALQYGTGTVIGAAAAALFLVPQPPPGILLVPLVVFAALIPYAMSRNYGLFGVIFTPLVVLLIGLISHGSWRLAEDRLIDVLLGCSIALSIGYAPWPSSWHANLPPALADAVQQAAHYLEQALGDAEPGPAAAAHAQARRTIGDLSINLQRAMTEPGPVRQQVTAWLPAMIALEQTLEAITAAATTSGQSAPAADVHELAAILRHTSTAIRSGTPLQPTAHLPRSRSLVQVSDAVRSLLDALTGPLPHPRDPLATWSSAPRRSSPRTRSSR